MKLKVTNISEREFGANAMRGTIMVKPGQTIEEEFSDNEAIGINGDTAIFKVEGFDIAKIEKSALVAKDAGERDKNGDTEEMAQMRQRFDVSYSTLQTENKNLRSDVAALTTERDALKGELATALANAGGKSEPMSLKDAVASLDNANETHWIGSGKPSLEHLKHLTGNDALTRSEVDAFDVVRKPA